MKHLSPLSLIPLGAALLALQSTTMAQGQVFTSGGALGTFLTPGPVDVDGDGTADINFVSFGVDSGFLDASAPFGLVGNIGGAPGSGAAWVPASSTVVAGDGVGRNEIIAPFRGAVASSDDNWSKVHFSSGDGWVKWSLGATRDIVMPLAWVREDTGVDLSAAGAEVLLLNVPCTPTISGSVALGTSPWAVTIEGSLAYVGDESSGVRIVDFSNPASPFIVSSTVTGDARAIELDGNLAYVANSSFGLSILDVTDPASPTIEGTVDTPSFSFDLKQRGNYVYLADFFSGLQVIDVTNPAAPVIVQTVDTPGQVVGVTLQGNYAFLADQGPGMQVVDITDPPNASLVTTLAVPDGCRRIASQGNVVYGATQTGVQVIDISNPTSPSLLGAVTTPDVVSWIDVEGTRAFAACFSGGLQVVDVSDPNAPSIVGSVGTVGDARGIAVEDGIACVADFSPNSLQIINVSSCSGAFTEDNTGQGINLNVQTAPPAILGQPWSAAVSVNDPALPSSGVLIMLYGSSSPSTGPRISLGGGPLTELLLVPGLITQPCPPFQNYTANTGIACQGVIIPNDTSLLGAAWCSQVAAGSPATGYTLTNAVCGVVTSF